MNRNLPPYLLKVLQFYVQGYSLKAIASELKLKPSTTQTYVKRIRGYFADEPEMKNHLLSPHVALVIVFSAGEGYCIYSGCPYNKPGGPKRSA
jgi:hypothetical protein